jgi:hypothetical protein
MNSPRDVTTEKFSRLARPARRDPKFAVAPSNTKERHKLTCDSFMKGAVRNTMSIDSVFRLRTLVLPR